MFSKNIIVFTLFFSVIFEGCYISKIECNVELLKQFNKFCDNIRWCFCSYEERIAYSVRPLLNNVAKDFDEIKSLRTEISNFLSRVSANSDDIKVKVDDFLKSVLHATQVDSAYRSFLSDIILKEISKEQKHIEYIVFCILIARDANHRKQELGGFIQQLSELYDKEKKVIIINKKIPINRKKEISNLDNDRDYSEVKGIYDLTKNKDYLKVKEKGIRRVICKYNDFEEIHGNTNMKQGLHPRSKNECIEGKEKLWADATLYRSFWQYDKDSKYLFSYYDIDELYDRFSKFFVNYSFYENYHEDHYRAFEGEVGQFCEDFLKALNDCRQDEFNKEVIFKDVRCILLDIRRTVPAMNDFPECISILSEMFFFSVFVLHVMSIDSVYEDFSSFSFDLCRRILLNDDLVNFARDELFSNNIQHVSKNQYVQGLGCFASFFVVLYFVDTFGVNMQTKAEKRANMIKLFVFYLLRQWSCDIYLDYLPSCSFNDLLQDQPLPFILFYLRRCAILFNREDIMKTPSAGKFFYFIYYHYMSAAFRTATIAHPRSSVFMYVLYRNIHPLIIQEKNFLLYFVWFSFITYQFYHQLSDVEMTDYCGPWEKIKDILTPSFFAAQNDEFYSMAEECKRMRNFCKIM